MTMNLDAALQSRAGALKLPTMGAGGSAPTAAAPSVVLANNETVDIPQPTKLDTVAPMKKSTAVVVDLEIRNVATFAKGATRTEVPETQVVKSEVAEQTDAFYAALPFTMAAVARMDIALRFQGAAQAHGRTPIPSLSILGLPEEW